MAIPPEPRDDLDPPEEAEEGEPNLADDDTFTEWDTPEDREGYGGLGEEPA